MTPAPAEAEAKEPTLREYTKAYNEELAANAKKAFERHELRRNDPDHWVIQRKHKDGNGWDSAFMASIVCAEPSTLIVTGDIALVAFAYGPADPHARVRWMGRNKGIDSYVHEKACIGTTDGGKLLAVYDADAARAWIRDCIADVRAEDEDDVGAAADRIAGYEEALDLADEQHELLEHLYGMGEYEIGHVGIVVKARLFYAHAALARLCDLLGMP